MNKLIGILFTLCLCSCGQSADNPAAIIENSVPVELDLVEEEREVEEEEIKKYHFYIMGENIQDGEGVLFDTILEDNYLELLDGAIQACLIYDEDSVEYLALSQRYAEGQCMYYRAEILQMLESNYYENITDQYFPGINLYKFYEFGDPHVNQLEGDEQTVFAGYQFDFSKEDYLGIQFMFCNQQDPEDSKRLNESGNINFIPFTH